MATSCTGDAEEELTCPVCRELFVNPDHTPKELSCPHVCCKRCLGVLVKSIDGTPAIKCPECREVTWLPYKGGITALRTNLRLQSLAEKQLKQKPASPESNCPKHGEKLYFYCVTCSELACPKCFLSHHQQPNHIIKDVSEFDEDKIKEMDNLISKCENKLSQCEKQVHVVGQLEEKILTQVAGEEREIDNAVEEAVAHVEEQGEILKAKLRSMYDTQLQQYKKQKRTIHDFRSTVDRARHVKEKSSRIEYLKQHKLLKDKLIKTLKSVSSIEETQIPANVPTFKMIQRPTPKKDAKMQMFKMIPEMGLILQVRELEPIWKLAGHESIRGMAAGPGGILAACSFRAVHIFQHKEQREYKQGLNPFEYKGYFSTGSTSNNGDVVVTKDGKYLVTKEHFVEQYDTLGVCKGTFYTTHDRTTFNVHLWCITTTPDERIIVGDRGRSVITIHTPAGDLVQKIHSHITPECVAAINSTDIAVGQGDKVYVIDFESKKEKLSIDIPSPRAICYDQESDCLLIARHDRNQEVKSTNNAPVKCAEDEADLGSVKMGSLTLNITGDDDGVIEQYSLANGCLVARIAQGLAIPCALTFVGESTLVVADFHEFIKIYKIT